VACRRRSAASSVVAHFGHGGRSSGCVNPTNVDERIATGWRGLDESKISSKHALVIADDKLDIASA